MNLVGQVESLWRYPVKSMRGEELPEIFVGFSGVYGDRLYAFKSSAAPAGFPFLTGRNCRAMLLYRPRFRDPEKAAKPVNMAEAKALSQLLSPLSATLADLAVEIETTSGRVLSIDDAELLHELGALAGEAHSLSVLRSERGMTDCRPISLLSLQTVTQLSDEVGAVIDKRRFRANVYLSLTAGGFAENEFVGRRVGVGEVVVAVLDRDPRCQMITIDPETAIADPEVLRKVARAHEGTAGIYGAVLAEGMIRKNDPVTLLD